MPDPASPVSAVVTCKGRLEHLRQTLPLLMALPLRQIVVVDYDCPDGSGPWVAEAFPQATLVRATDRPHFNASAARNLGAAAATAPWLLFIDADTRVTPGLWDALVARLAPGVFIVAKPRVPELCGTFVTARSDFEALGGFDETFQGWGAEDTDFLERLEMLGRRQDFYDASLASAIAHGHDLRMRHHRADNPHRTGLLNNIYRSAKNDLARQGVNLDAAGRQNLYEQLRRAFEAEAPARSYEVEFRQQAVSGVTLSASLKYQLKSPVPPPTPPGSAEQG
jgi:glycosyltransferase involved in cell wall biosynthesis